MRGKYDDIINLPHHMSLYHAPMPMYKRAAQFAPFSPLEGYKEAQEEAVRRNEAMYEPQFEELPQYL